MADNLPEEVLINILSRLPVQSLLKFTSVCKTWRSLISSTHFITTHLTRSPSNPQYTPYLLFRHFTHSYEDRFTLHPAYDPFPLTHFTEQLEFDLNLSEPKGFFDCASNSFIDLHPPDNSINLKVVGYSNGVLCLVDDCIHGEAAILWNPSIRKTIRLPRPNVTYKSHGFFGHSFGFGYHAPTDDYKLVRVVFLGCKLKTGYYFNTAKILVEIFTLKTGSWRSIITHVPMDQIRQHCLSVFLNGAVHWLVHSSSSANCYFRSVIVLFSLGDEVFHEMAVPASLEWNRIDQLKMSVAAIDGSLALVPFEECWEVESFSVWVMKDYGVVESWTKLYDLSIGKGIRVLYFRENGEVLVCKHNRGLLSYEPSTGKTLDLRIRAHIDSFYLDTYVESLVLLNAGDGVS